MLTSFMLLYPRATNVKRGPYVDRRIRPDAEFTHGNKRCFVEFDTGEESHRQVRHKWARNYQGVVRGHRFDLLLVVTTSEKRLPTLIKNAKRVSDFALFTTFDAVTADPYGQVWVDCHGGRGGLSKPRE